TPGAKPSIPMSSAPHGSSGYSGGRRGGRRRVLHLRSTESVARAQHDRSCRCREYMGHLPTAEQERHLRLCPTYQHSAEAVTAGSEAERAAIVEWLRSDGLNTYDA